MIRKRFGELNVGDIFYVVDDENEDKMLMCMKCSHFDTMMIEAMLEANEWVDSISNAVWLEDGSYITTGTLDWFPDNVKVWVG